MEEMTCAGGHGQRQRRLPGAGTTLLPGGTAEEISLEIFKDLEWMVEKYSIRFEMLRMRVTGSS